MKRHIQILVVCCLSLGLVGCFGGGADVAVVNSSVQDLGSEQRNLNGTTVEQATANAENLEKSAIDVAVAAVVEPATTETKGLFGRLFSKIG